MKIQAAPEMTRSRRQSGGLLPLESEMISIFVQVAETLSLPRSLGEIYGLLFCAKEPLCFDDIVQRLQISGGSTSQGLKFLRHMGAIRVVYQPKDRRDFFAAEVGLRSLASGILKQKLEPALTSGTERLARMESLRGEANAADSAHFAERIAILRKWHGKAAKIFPLILQFLK
jgi:DNA-binding transcriptional regulator GbsR (MarR family)